MDLTNRRKMDRIKEIVRIIYNIDNVDINSFEYKFIETLRETCDGSQESIEQLVNLTSQMTYLASLKNNEYITKVFQNVTNIFYPKLSGGCHANRDIPKLITDSGLKIDEKDTMYLPGSVKFLGFNYWGVAIR